MKFTSENPARKYAVACLEEITLFLDENDISSQTIKNAEAFCALHGYAREEKVTAVYYLRGHRYQADYEQVLKGILYSDALPEELFEVIHCLSFWNQEGSKNYAMNKTANESYSDFILRCIAADCRTFVTQHPEQFITGKGGKHVWIDDSTTHERMLLIHF